jgi:hypothetical protein
MVAIKSIFIKLLLIVLGVGLAITPVIVLEICLGYLMLSKSPLIKQISGPVKKVSVQHPILGYAPHKDISWQSIEKTADQRTIYDVRYSIDQIGRRIVPLARSGAQKFAIFFGCSFTFGEGLNDNETLAYYFSEKEPSFQGHNYGYSGYGPQHMFMQLQQPDFKLDVSQNEGIAIYVFIDAHLERLLGSQYSFNKWCKHCPSLALDSNLKVRYQGSFSKSRPLLSLIYEILKHSNISKYFNINIKSRPSREALTLLLEVIKQSKDRFIDHFPKGKFYVLLYPGSKLAKEISSPLVAEGIHILNFSDFTYLRRGEYVIDPEDIHPSSAANRELALKISDYMSME